MPDENEDKSAAPAGILARLDADSRWETEQLVRLLAPGLAQWGAGHMTKARVRQARAFIQAMRDRDDEEGDGPLCDLGEDGKPAKPAPKTVAQPQPLNHFGHNQGR